MILLLSVGLPALPQCLRTLKWNSDSTDESVDDIGRDYSYIRKSFVAFVKAFISLWRN